MAFNPRDLLKQLQEMQGKVAEMQGRLKELRVTGSSGGDMVRIELDGQFSVRSIRISPDVVNPSDVKMLEDLVHAAFSDALARLKERMREEASGLTGGMGLPPGIMGL